MVEVEIINNIGLRVLAHQKIYGSSKTWMAKQMGYKSKQAFDGAINSPNPTLETLARVAFFFRCNIKDLYEVHYYLDGEEIEYITEKNL